MKSPISLSDAIQELLKKKHLLSAKDLSEYFEHAGRAYNKTSIYRALDQLLAEDIICRYDFNDAEAQYELRDHHHDHFVCEHCGKIETIDCQITQPIQVKNHTVSHHHLTVFGECENCKSE